jgi:hypothetical protein
MKTKHTIAIVNGTKSVYITLIISEIFIIFKASNSANKLPMYAIIEVKNTMLMYDLKVIRMSAFGKVSFIFTNKFGYLSTTHPNTDVAIPL